MDIELLLAELYLTLGERISTFFVDQDRLRQLADDLCEEPARRISLPPGVGVAMEVDPSVTRLLWSAARIARALGQEMISVEAFVAALAVDDETLRKLSEHRGIELRGSLKE